MNSSFTPREKITGEVIVPQTLEKEVVETIKTVSDLKKNLDLKKDGDVSEVLAFLLYSALRLDASDIHAEPTKENVKIRFRIDGLLQDVHEIPTSFYETLVSRIKLVSGIKLNVTDRPQDGRFSLVFSEEEPIEIRTSTLPSEYGESLVLRILNPKSLIAVKDLGLRKDLQDLFEKEIKKPTGMIVVTGPTGSGKTTTLYAFLNEVKNPEIKVITIEDPIEYHLEGISQTQVNPEKGYDFASGLRAIVRQDPDVLLIGEIRDGETADIALESALTGHLVFSTLHTNDAAGTISRFTSLGSKIPVVASALTLIVAQRLVRKVCTHCAEKISPTPEETQLLKESLVLLGKPKEKIEKLSHAKGCSFCNQTGYKGRIGIYEAILVDNKVEEFVLLNPSTSAFKKFAIERGMIPLHEDGILKVLEGVTTLEEVERVTSE